MSREKRVVLRDLAIFQIKLMLDGLKDVMLSPVAIGAAALDVVFPGEQVGHRFYGVLRVAERIDGWLNLFGAATRADARRDGLFGASRAGSDSLLGKLEAFVVGTEEAESATSRRAA